MDPSNGRGGAEQIATPNDAHGVVLHQYSHRHVPIGPGEAATLFSPSLLQPFLASHEGDKEREIIRPQ